MDSRGSLQAEGKVKDVTILERLNRDFDRQNDHLCSHIESLEKLSDKLKCVTQSEKDSGQEQNKPQHAGLLTDLGNHVDRFGILNSRLESIIIKLQELV